jgi:hypothetical protein
MSRISILIQVIFVIGGIIPIAQAQTTSDVILTVSGEAEMVFDWTTDRCDDEDIPDLPARAFRDADEQVQLIATHFVARRSIGDDLDTVEHDCRIIANSVYDADPSQYSDKEWLASFFTEDGETIYALQHNEYQGHTHTGQCPSGDYFDCWYNSITLAISEDRGESFANITTPPNHLVASSPYPYEGGAGPYGVFEASNMIRAEDGYIYSIIRIDEYKSERQRVCLMRTNNIADPTSWRAWDGEAFTLPLPRPYTAPSDDPQAQYCAPLAQDQIGVMNQSLTYNTFLEQYVLVGLSADRLDNREVWGIYYAFSDDLITWSHRQLLMEVELPWTYEWGDDDPILYPSLIDPDSTSRNFATTDQDAYLYFTQFNYNRGQMTLDRDLVRIPVRFEWLESAVMDLPEYEVSFSGQVPDDATGALVGYRVNTECECNGIADFSLYGIRYEESGNSQNIVPNAVFAQDLVNWNIRGNGDVVLQPSDLGDGQMLDVTVTTNQISALNGAVFSVEAGADYTVTFVADVELTTTDSGYFVLIFLGANGEIQRQLIAIVPTDDVLP